MNLRDPKFNFKKRKTQANHCSTSAPNKLPRFNQIFILTEHKFPIDCSICYKLQVHTIFPCCICLVQSGPYPIHLYLCTRITRQNSYQDLGLRNGVVSMEMGVHSLRLLKNGMGQTVCFLSKSNHFPMLNVCILNIYLWG